MPCSFRRQLLDKELLVLKALRARTNKITVCYGHELASSTVSILTYNKHRPAKLPCCTTILSSLLCHTLGLYAITTLHMHIRSMYEWTSTLTIASQLPPPSSFTAPSPLLNLPHTPLIRHHILPEQFHPILQHNPLLIRSVLWDPRQQIHQNIFQTRSTMATHLRHRIAVPHHR